LIGCSESGVPAREEGRDSSSRGRLRLARSEWRKASRQNQSAIVLQGDCGGRVLTCRVLEAGDFISYSKGTS